MHHKSPSASVDWKPVHSASVRGTPEGHLILNDGTSHDWHLIRATSDSFCSLVQLKIHVIPLQECNSEFYLNHWGSIDVCRIDPAGNILDRGITRELSVSKHDDGSLEITAEFQNLHETISMGTSRGPGGRYQGEGKDQFLFRSIEVIPIIQPEIDENQRITLVDVGALGGLQKKWHRCHERIRPILLEPNPVAAAELRRRFTAFPGAMVIEAALHDKAETRTLHVTRHPGCTSLLEPDMELLKRYRVAGAFEVIRTLEVRCERYDDLFRFRGAPMPDVIKIDVQGAEYEVLLGFGYLLESCLAIELETHIYPIYKNQKLFGDLVRLLDGFGFSLRSLERQNNFDGDALEFNCCFTKRRDMLPQPRESAEQKLAFIEQVLALAVFDGGLEIARRLGTAE